MKKITIKLLMASLIMWPSISVAATDARHINVRMSPSVLLGFANARIDVKVHQNISAGIMVDYSMLVLKYYSYGLGLSFKLDGQDIMSTNGWYLNPYATYAYGRFKFDGDSTEKASNKTGGLIIGYQWIAKSGFNFRLGVGAQYNSSEVFGKKLLPDFSMTLGYAF